MEKRDKGRKSGRDDDRLRPLKMRLSIEDALRGALAAGSPPPDAELDDSSDGEGDEPPPKAKKRSR